MSPYKQRLFLSYIAAAWVAVLILGLTILAGNSLGQRALPFRVGGGLIAVLAGTLVWMAVSEPMRLKERVKHATRKVAEQEARYRALYEEAPLIYLTLAGDGTITRANRRAVEVLGYEREELVGAPLTELLAEGEQQAEDARGLLEALLAGDIEHTSLELGLTRADGTVMWGHLTLREAPADQADGRALSMVVDVTDRKRAVERMEHYAAELERSNRDLDAFASVASHDLQAPLRMVKSYVQLLQRRYEGELDEDADEFIGFAVDGVEKMEGLIQDLLAYARAGTGEHEVGPVDLDEVLDEVQELLRADIEATQAEIVPEDLPTVQGDGKRLRQVLQNLLSNALKYHGKAPPRVHVRATKGPGTWLLEVEDQGPGIPETEQEGIFEIFRRGSEQVETEGSGVGLAICKRIVERHGGRIWVESEPGQGASFRFSLPRGAHRPSGSSEPPSLPARDEHRRADP